MADRFVFFVFRILAIMGFFNVIFTQDVSLFLIIAFYTFFMVLQEKARMVVSEEVSRPKRIPPVKPPRNGKRVVFTCHGCPAGSSSATKEDIAHSAPRSSSNLEPIAEVADVKIEPTFHPHAVKEHFWDHCIKIKPALPPLIIESAPDQMQPLASTSLYAKPVPPAKPPRKCKRVAITCHRYPIGSSSATKEDIANSDPRLSSNLEPISEVAATCCPGFQDPHAAEEHFGDHCIQIKPSLPPLHIESLPHQMQASASTSKPKKKWKSFKKKFSRNRKFF